MTRERERKSNEEKTQELKSVLKIFNILLVAHYSKAHGLPLIFF